MEMDQTGKDGGQGGDQVMASCDGAILTHTHLRSITMLLTAGIFMATNPQALSARLGVSTFTAR